MEDDSLNCNICFRLAREALECNHPKCHKLFCKGCYSYITQQMKNEEKETKCPFCRVQPFAVIDSPLRQKINNKPIKCKYCNQAYKFQIIEQHESQCDDRKIRCQICDKAFKKKQILTHTKNTHRERIDKIIMNSHMAKYPLIEPQKVLAKEAGKMKYETLPRIGVTGKFYCQGDLLGPKCYCCNGKCGPTNGENCVKCMQLDMTRRGLPKGYLVHANGQVCWLDNNQHFNCGLMYSIQRKTCGKEGYCKWCHNLQKTMNRYEALM